MKIVSYSSEETIQWAAGLAKHLKPGDIVCLVGDLGTGKTTLTKGLAKGLNIKMDAVNSPTFVLMNIYEGKIPVYHFDLYRIEGQEQLGLIGYDEFLYGDGVAVVEWAERLNTLMPTDYLLVTISQQDENKRVLEVKAHGSRYQSLLKKI